MISAFGGRSRGIVFGLRDTEDVGGGVIPFPPDVVIEWKGAKGTMFPEPFLLTH